jgi:hypothetical protein
LAVTQAVHEASLMLQSEEHCSLAQIDTGKTASTAPWQPLAMHLSQQGPTRTPPFVNRGASAPGQLWTHVRTSLHIPVPSPVMEMSEQVLKSPSIRG